MITLDFETHAIEGNPLVNPPAPVGLAHIGLFDDSSPVYTEGYDAMKVIWHQALNSGKPLLFHNAPFDLSVGLKWLGGSAPHWERVHDTVFLLFLDNPYSNSLSLKPSAEHYLREAPEEQNDLHDWIMSNVPEATKTTAGAYISLAPSSLVAPYAQGDVRRTLGLFNLLHPNCSKGAYDRERRLSPILTKSSQHGIRVDRGRLGTDLDLCTDGLERVEGLIFNKLGCDPFNIGSGAQLADRLDKAGVVEKWFYTPKGRKSTAKDNLMQGISDKELLNLLTYRSTMSTCVGTFMSKWYDLSEADGRVHTEWNQVANDERGHAGARTGRLSSSRPNFQNPPNPFDWLIPDGLPPLPNMREYLLPEEGHVWIKRDFSSQEIRILAHFEDGNLMLAYQGDPFLDPHNMAQGLMKEFTGKLYERPDVKITGFSIIYGSGVPGLAQQLKRPPGEAFELREAYFKAMPAAAQLAASTRDRGKSGGVITTWGGRDYPVEPPKMVKGRMRTFEYKLLNYLIQGSAADQTKQVLADWDETYNTNAVFMATIHDEINASAPVDTWEQEMEMLRLAMDQDLFDVPMRSEGFVGPNWGSLQKIEGEYK